MKTSQQINKENFEKYRAEKQAKTLEVLKEADRPLATSEVHALAEPDISVRVFRSTRLLPLFKEGLVEKTEQGSYGKTELGPRGRAEVKWRIKRED